MLSKQIKRLLPFSFKGVMKEKILGLCQVPWSRTGMPAPLMTALHGMRDIVLVDIGASEGEFVTQVQGFCGVSRALLIEPQPSRCEQLRRNFSSPNYNVVCSAVGEAERKIEMEILRWDYSSSILPVKRDRPEINAMFDLNV